MILLISVRDDTHKKKCLDFRIFQQGEAPNSKVAKGRRPIKMVLLAGRFVKGGGRGSTPTTNKYHWENTPLKLGERGGGV